MESFFMGPKAHILDAEKYGKQIREVINNIEVANSRENDWHPDIKERFEIFEKKAGENHCNMFRNESSPDVPEWMKPFRDNEIILWFANASGKEENDKLNKEWGDMTREDDKLKRKSMAKAFQIIGKNIYLV